MVAYSVGGSVAGLDGLGRHSAVAVVAVAAVVENWLRGRGMADSLHSY